jgi:malic enzyme
MLNKIKDKLIESYHKDVNDRILKKFKTNILEDIDFSKYNIIHTYAGKQLVDNNGDIIMGWSNPTVKEINGEYMFEYKIDNEIIRIGSYASNKL